MGPRRAERKVTDQMQIEKFGCVFCSVFVLFFGVLEMANIQTVPLKLQRKHLVKYLPAVTI